jgi:tetratricopeptide (TPR) repeat protein/tRNA A-37 threonylcarbamoyl transferase component Bud32
MGVICRKCGTDNTQDSEFCKKCATPLTRSEEKPIPTETLEVPKEELTTGSTFAGRYQIIEELGRGGMGRVYKAQDTEIKEKIALKLIKPEISSDKKTIERFQNELKLARKISHRNVCRMHHLEKSEGNSFITMEYVDGENLKGMIRMMGQLSSGKAISIAKQVCEGLSEAHRIGVVHRDLKPSNIMIDKEGNAKIMDFGIARSLTGKGITGVGVMIGTPEYMSPEQVESKEIDQRSDIYSLGVILYEMVTGRVPFEGDTPYSIGVKHKSETPRNPKEINPQISDDLNRLILKCLEKEKEKRYQSAGELRSELENIESGMPTTDRVIPERKPLTSKEITVTFGLKKLLVPALAIVAFVIIAVFIWKPWSQKAPLPVPSDKPSLAVMYFENNTGDENLDHWRKGISDLLITDLTQSKYLSVLGGDRLFNILQQLDELDSRSFSSDVLAEVASRGRVNHILRGSYSKAGNTIRIDTVLQDATTGEPIATSRVEGIGEEGIFSMVDELTGKIKTSFNFSEEKIASDLDEEIGKITTNSPEAYKYYIEGDNYQKAGNARNAIESYKKAVEVDPEFALAYNDMGIQYYNLGMRDEEKKYLKKAYELREKVSEKERYEIEASFYGLSEKTYGESIEAFNKLIKLSPEQPILRADLGWTYMRLEQWDKAIEQYSIITQSKYEAVNPYTNLALSYRAKGLYDKAAEVLENYLIDFSDNSQVRLSLAINYLCQGKYDLALSEANKAISLATTISSHLFSKGIVHLCQGDFANAEFNFQKSLNGDEIIAKLLGISGRGSSYLTQGRLKESANQYKKGIELLKERGDKDWECLFHLWMGYICLKSENLSKALDEYNKAWDVASEEGSLFYQEESLFFKGLTYLKMKSLSDAQRMADELKESLESGLNDARMRYYYHLMGMIELSKENYSKATGYFNDALTLIPFQCHFWLFEHHALFMEPLASAYYISGDIDSAEREYERIINLTTGRLDFGDIYAKSFYMLGKIYEQKDFKGKAIENYEKFLDLWKDADPGIDEVEDARKRLAGLRAE